MRYWKPLIVLLTMILTLIIPAAAQAQSDVRTPDQKILFTQMDPVLYGYWEGHGDGAGMKFDPEAIACMVQKCAAVQAAFSRASEACSGSADPNCPYAQVRNSRYYSTCYREHLKRIKKPGYQRLADPPALTSLTCSSIVNLRQSSDDSIYTAVNGRARPEPPSPAPVQGSGPPKIKLQLGESEKLMAELGGGARGNPQRNFAHTGAAAKTDDPSAPASTRPRGGLDGFVIIATNEREAVLKVLPGGNYYTIERSFLAHGYETDSLKVMNYRRDGQSGTGNDRAQIFFPFHLKPGKIELYRPRMSLKANDLKARLGSIDSATQEFMQACKTGGCEARFALQAGEILRLPRKAQPMNVAANDSADGTGDKPPAKSSVSSDDSNKAPSQDKAPPMALAPASPSASVSPIKPAASAAAPIQTATSTSASPAKETASGSQSKMPYILWAAAGICAAAALAMYGFRRNRADATAEALRMPADDSSDGIKPSDTPSGLEQAETSSPTAAQGGAEPSGASSHAQSQAPPDVPTTADGSPPGQKEGPAPEKTKLSGTGGGQGQAPKDGAYQSGEVWSGKQGLTNTLPCPGGPGAGARAFSPIIGRSGWGVGPDEPTVVNFRIPQGKIPEDLSALVGQTEKQEPDPGKSSGDGG